MDDSKWQLRFLTFASYTHNGPLGLSILNISYSALGCSFPGYSDPTRRGEGGREGGTAS